MDFKRRCLTATGETCSRPKAAMLTGQAQAGQCLQLKPRFFCPGEIGTAGAASSSPPLLTVICNGVSVVPPVDAAARSRRCIFKRQFVPHAVPRPLDKM